MVTCKECKWWIIEITGPYDHYRYCRNEHFTGNSKVAGIEPKDNNNLISFSSNAGTTWCHTGKDFGCIHGEKND